MNRLLVLASTIVFLDAALFGALIPLLPGYVDDFDLTKLDVGLVFGAYGAGALIGGIPGGLIAARFGPKTAVVLGLSLLVVACLAFAIAGGPVALGLSRLVQGFSSALTWAGALSWVSVETERGRRGQALGTVFGVAVFGFVTGPVVGAAAHLTSIRVAFTAVAVLAAVLAAATSFHPRARAEIHAPNAARRALGDPRFLAGLWLNLLPAFFYGILDVLATLALDAGGYGVPAIGAVFVLAGLVEVGFNPFVGRVSDARGRLLPVRYGLLASVVVGIALALAEAPAIIAILVVVAALSYGSFYTPGMALVADRSEVAGLPQGLGFGLTNTAWALGASLGPAVGGGMAEATSDAVPYLLSSLLCGLTLLAIARARRDSVIA